MNRRPLERRTWLDSIPHRAAFVTTAAVIAFSTAAPTGVAHAQDQRLYAGVTGIASELSTSVDKSVDTRAPNTLVPEPRRGQLLHDQATGSVVSYGPGLLAGYRHPIIENTLYVAVEADVAFDNEEVDSEFQGVGESAGRNQLGESWPDRWFYDSDQNVGVSVRLGFLAGPLRTWNASFYALVGLRRINGTFSTHFNGCLSPTPCSSSPDTPNFVSGTDSRGPRFPGWHVRPRVRKARSPARRGTTRIASHAVRRSRLGGALRRCRRDRSDRGRNKADRADWRAWRGRFEESGNQLFRTAAPASPCRTMRPMKIIDDQHVGDCLDYRTLIEALRSGFARQSSHPIHMRAETGVDEDSKVLLVKAAWDQDVTVIKAQTLNRSNKQSGLPFIQGLIAIFDKASGTPLAIVDAKEITNRRTAAASALAADYLATPKCQSHDPDRHGRAGPAHGACTYRDQTHSTNQCLRSKPGQGGR